MYPVYRVKKKCDVERAGGRREADTDIDEGIESREADAEAQSEGGLVEGGGHGERADGQKERHFDR